MQRETSSFVSNDCLKFKRQYHMSALKLGDREHSGFPMLERTSRFVLEVLPYVLSALIAAVVVPGFLYSQAPSTKAAATPNVDRRGERDGGRAETRNEHEDHQGRGLHTCSRSLTHR